MKTSLLARKAGMISLSCWRFLLYISKCVLVFTLLPIPCNHGNPFPYTHTHHCNGRHYIVICAKASSAEQLKKW